MTLTDTAEGDILKIGETLLPGGVFTGSWADIRAGRQIAVFDSHPTGSEDKSKLPVVFFHGFPDNAMSARFVASQLATNSNGDGGRRCLLLSCPGYDARNAPPNRGTLDVGSVARDYWAAIDAILGNSARFHLVGHDWGAMHAKAMAQSLKDKADDKGHNQQDRIASLTMVAVPHNSTAGFKRYPYAQVNNFWYIAFFQLPFLPEWWIRYGGGLERLWNVWSPALDVASDNNHKAYFESVRQTLIANDRSYVLHSAISMYRDTAGISFLFQFWILQLIFGIRWLLRFDNTTFQFPPEPSNQEERDEEAAFFIMPVMGITGSNDGCIDTRLFDVTMKSTPPTARTVSNAADNTYPSGCTLLRVPNAGHFVFAEAPDPVVQALTPFLAGADKLNWK